MYHLTQTAITLKTVIERTKKNSFMDICFVGINDRTHIRANTVHGMLWLQTHFEVQDWEAIAAGQVILSISNAEMLAMDATKAGLTINLVPAITHSKK